MLAHRVVVCFPLVEEDAAERADDVVGLVWWLGVVEEACTREDLWRRLALVDLPFEGPVEVRREAVVVLIERLVVEYRCTRWHCYRLPWAAS